MMRGRCLTLFCPLHLMLFLLPPPRLICNARLFSFRTALSLAFSPPRRLRISPMSSSAADDGAAASVKKGRLRGLVFDMDGTLTVPVIDFEAMYRAVLGEEGYAPWRSARATGGGVDILHHIESWPTAEKLRAYETIAHFERQGLDRLQIMPGALELCKYLDSREMRRGLITRNVKASVDIFHQRFGMEFVPALSREFCPCKPDPAPLLHICSIWDIPPSEVMMIGDSLRDDVACGKRAGAYTCLLDETGRYDSLDSYDDDLKPDFKVSSLSQVLLLLENHFELVPRLQTA